MKVKNYEKELNVILNKINTTIVELQNTGLFDLKSISYANVKLATNDNEKAYQNTGKAFNFVIFQINALAKMINEWGLINFATGNPTQGVASLNLKSIEINTVDKKLASKLKEMNQTLTSIIQTLTDYQFLNENGTPIPPDTDEPEIKPDPNDNGLQPLEHTMYFTGLQKMQSLPEANIPSTQGAAFDDNFYYVFGHRQNDNTLMLQVLARNLSHSSFVVEGGLGDFISTSNPGPQNNYERNKLGHANDAVVIGKQGDKVTLLVATLEENMLATAIVDIKNQTAALGVRIPLKPTVSQEMTGKFVIGSVQKIDDGKIMMYGNNALWTADYNDKGMMLKRMGKYTKSIAQDFVSEQLGSNFTKTLTGQANYYHNGYIYLAYSSDDWSKSIIVELIPKGSDKYMIPSNRVWWISSGSSRRYEIEKVWFEGEQMMGNFSMGDPWDNFIAKLNWRN